MLADDIRRRPRNSSQGELSELMSGVVGHCVASGRPATLASSSNPLEARHVAERQRPTEAVAAVGRPPARGQSRVGGRHRRRPLARGGRRRRLEADPGHGHGRAARAGAPLRSVVREGPRHDRVRLLQPRLEVARRQARIDGGRSHPGPDPAPPGAVGARPRERRCGRGGRPAPEHAERPPAAVPRQGGVRARQRPDPPRARPEDAALRGARARARRRQGAGAPDRAPGPSDPHGADQGVRSRCRPRNPPPRRGRVEALARRVPREPLTRALLVLLIAAPAAAAGSGSILASYSFEDAVATGPDTFAIFQAARHVGTGQGRVSLSSAFHVSGYRSVEIKDVAGGGDFPGLPGYFPVRTAGRLCFHFAFLTTDAKEELNVALAGPRFFQLDKDGIAFWLGTREGRLVHVSDGIPKKLFPVEAFVWYAVDVAYDLVAGTYALTIHREGQKTPVVALRDQPNTTRRPGSAVDKFSFVGSPYGDTSSVVYYVDDVVIGTDESVAQLPFVAPGRRKLFVDLFAEYQRRLRERPRCLPLTGPDDVGLSSADLADLGRAGLLDSVKRVF